MLPRVWPLCGHRAGAWILGGSCEARRAAPRGAMAALASAAVVSRTGLFRLISPCMGDSAPGATVQLGLIPPPQRRCPSQLRCRITALPAFNVPARAMVPAVAGAGVGTGPAHGESPIPAFAAHRRRKNDQRAVKIRQKRRHESHRSHAPSRCPWSTERAGGRDKARMQPGNLWWIFRVRLLAPSSTPDGGSCCTAPNSVVYAPRPTAPDMNGRPPAAARPCAGRPPGSSRPTAPPPGTRLFGPFWPFPVRSSLLASPASPVSWASLISLISLESDARRADRNSAGIPGGPAPSYANSSRYSAT